MMDLWLFTQCLPLQSVPANKEFRLQNYLWLSGVNFLLLPFVFANCHMLWFNYWWHFWWYISLLWVIVFAICFELTRSDAFVVSKVSAIDSSPYWCEREESVVHFYQGIKSQMVTIIVILILIVNLVMMSMDSVYWCQYWCWCWWGSGWGNSHRQEKQIYVKDSGYGVNGNPDISEHSVNRLLYRMAKTTLRKMGELCMKYLHYFQGWDVIWWCSCKKQDLHIKFHFK